MSDGDGVARTFKFLRNGETEPLDMDWKKGIETARQAISEAMNAKNVGFLLGAGCSSLMKDGKDVGIPTMAPLAKEFCGETLAAVAAGFDAAEPTTGEDQSGEDGEDNSELTGSQEYWVRGADGAEARIKADIGEDADPQLTTGAAPWRLTKEEFECLAALGIDLEKAYNRKPIKRQRGGIRSGCSESLYPLPDGRDGHRAIKHRQNIPADGDQRPVLFDVFPRQDHWAVAASNGWSSKMVHFSNR